MTNGLHGCIPYHSWPCPSHHLANLLTLFWSIAVGRTILASRFLFAISAMIQTTTSEICQMQVFIWHLVLMKMMTTIKLYHLADCSFLSFYSTHFLLYSYLNLNSLWTENTTLVITVASSAWATYYLIARITKFNDLGIHSLLASYSKRYVDEADIRFRRICIDSIRPLHQFQSYATIRESENICP